MSDGSIPAASIAFKDASFAMNQVGSPDDTRRSLMPVLVVIHSSEVSRKAVKLALSAIFDGRYEPVPLIFIPDIVFPLYSYCFYVKSVIY